MSVSMTTSGAVDQAAGGGQGGQMPPAKRDGRDGRVSESAAARLSRELLSDEAIDALLADAGEGGVRLTGVGGFLPELAGAVLSRARPTPDPAAVPGILVRQHRRITPDPPRDLPQLHTLGQTSGDRLTIRQTKICARRLVLPHHTRPRALTG